MTVAVATAILRCINEKKPLQPLLVEEMQRIGRRFSHLGYGGRFFSWLNANKPKPYNSFGNGSAMRVSPCGLIAVTLDEALNLAKASAEVTHNHPEGIKGAEATAAAVFLAKSGHDKDEIDDYICEHFYNLSMTLEQIRPTYKFDSTCQGTVPQALTAFLESTDYEDAIRNAISLGGDADTLGAITGGIAWSYYRFRHNNYGNTAQKMSQVWPEWCQRMVRDYNINLFLPDEFRSIIEQFDIMMVKRAKEYSSTGSCCQISIS